MKKLTRQELFMRSAIWEIVPLINKWLSFKENAPDGEVTPDSWDGGNYPFPSFLGSGIPAYDSKYRRGHIEIDVTPLGNPVMIWHNEEESTK